MRYGDLFWRRECQKAPLPFTLTVYPLPTIQVFSAAAYPILLFVYLGTDKNIYPVAASHHMNVEPL